MRKKIGRYRHSNGFTLIELFVVIAIIAILVAILMPAINAAVNQAKRTSANADARSIVTAWKNYFNEYGRWPVFNNELFGGVAGGTQVAEENVSTGMVTVVNIMTNIMYPDSSMSWGGWEKNMNPICTNFNPKRETFMTFRAQGLNDKGDLIDPWAKPYKFMFDVNRDGKVDRKALGSLGATSVYDSVISWSTGPDGVESDDDLNSWE